MATITTNLTDNKSDRKCI